MGIFNWFGNILGYLLWFFYLIVKNYGVAIIIFTLVLKALMFPLSLKQQKSMAMQSKMAAKQAEIKKKYGDDKVKYNEEIQKLYQKEGVNPAGGCLTSLIPFPIMIGLYYAVIYPLQNAMHLNTETISKATALLGKIPGVGINFSSGAQYAEMEIVKHFSNLKEYLTMFSGDELSKIEEFSRSFNFLGLDLLATPSGSAFATMLWIIPVLCLLTAWGQQLYMTKKQPGMQAQQGCMKYSMYLLPLISVYFSFIMPGAIGFYWVISAIAGILQSVIMYTYFGPAQLTAKMEAARGALRFEEEDQKKPLSASAQKKAEQRFAAQMAAKAESAQKQNTQKEKKKNSNKNTNSDYVGSKK